MKTIFIVVFLLTKADVPVFHIIIIIIITIFIDRRHHVVIDRTREKKTERK